MGSLRNLVYSQRTSGRGYRFLCNPIVLHGFAHFTISRVIEVRFASLKLATFSTSVAKQVHLGISSSRVATFSTSVVREVRFGSSGSKVTTFQYKCSKGTLAAPARKSQLFSTSVAKEVRFGSSGSKVATFQHKCSKGSTRLKRLNFSVQV